MSTHITQKQTEICILNTGLHLQGPKVSSSINVKSKLLYVLQPVFQEDKHHITYVYTHIYTNPHLLCLQCSEVEQFKCLLQV